MKETFSEILKKEKQIKLRHLEAKIPEWAFTEGFIIPNRLSLEQCSSKTTAAIKAELALRITNGKCECLADLTGGLGVDCSALSAISRKVYYNDINPELTKAAASNFKLLGYDNIEISCKDASERLADLGHLDIIFIDPSRRSDTGHKVFLLEDCSPNILGMRTLLTAHTSNLLLKLSPMADITQITRQLGKEVREVHVIGSGGECKELLVWVDFSWSGECTIFVHEEENSFSFLRSQDVQCRYPLNTDNINGLLYVPGNTVMKAAPFNLLCRKFNLIKIGLSTNLYIGESEDPNALVYGRYYGIREVLPFKKSLFKEIRKRYPKCEVTARNVPITSENLSKKMGVVPGGDIHIFAITANLRDEGQKRLFIVTDTLSRNPDPGR